MAKNYGIKDIESWEFETLPLAEDWLNHLGDLNQGFRILIEGDPKNGKTEYLLKLCKELALKVGKVNFNSTEQGKSKSFKKAWIRNRMGDIPAGKFMLAEKSQKDFTVWYRKICQPNSGTTIVLDSADYMKLNFDQWKMMHERFPQKNLIMVCWRINPFIKAFKHTMDTVILVKDFKAYPVSRLGGNNTMVIWDKRTNVGQQMLAL